MTVYEHNESAVGELDVRKIPVLRGEIFCAPFCGAKCKKSAYDNALQQSNEIALRLGSGWEPEVYENLGWHWQVTKGTINVSSSVKGYYAQMKFEQQQNYNFSAHDLDPRKAVQKVRDQLQDIIDKLERLHASTALDPISLP